MRITVSAGMVAAALLLAGCSTSNELSSSGQSVRFVEEKPGAECPLLGTATGEQSNWLSGQHGEEGGSMRGAANELRNNAAAMGGNVLYGVSSPSQNLLSSFVPTASKWWVRFINARTDPVLNDATTKGNTLPFCICVSVNVPYGE